MARTRNPNPTPRKPRDRYKVTLHYREGGVVETAAVRLMSTGPTDAIRRAISKKNVDGMDDITGNLMTISVAKEPPLPRKFEWTKES